MHLFDCGELLHEAWSHSTVAQNTLQDWEELILFLYFLLMINRSTNFSRPDVSFPRERSITHETDIGHEATERLSCFDDEMQGDLGCDNYVYYFSMFWCGKQES